MLFSEILAYQSISIFLKGKIKSLQGIYGKDL